MTLKRRAYSDFLVSSQKDGFQTGKWVGNTMVKRESDPKTVEREA